MYNNKLTKVIDFIVFTSFSLFLILNIILLINTNNTIKSYNRERAIFHRLNQKYISLLDYNKDMIYKDKNINDTFDFYSTFPKLSDVVDDFHKKNEYDINTNNCVHQSLHLAFILNSLGYNVESITLHNLGDGYDHMIDRFYVYVDPTNGSIMNYGDFNKIYSGTYDLNKITVFES